MTSNCSRSEGEVSAGPNTRLQRTRMRSPLSRQALGNARSIVAAVALVIFTCALFAGCATSLSKQVSSLTVLATDAEGSPIPGITISATHVRTVTRTETTTDKAGRARLEGLEPGRWLVSGPSFGTESTHAIAVILSGGANAEAHLVVSTKIIDSVNVTGHR